MISYPGIGHNHTPSSRRVLHIAAKMPDKDNSFKIALMVDTVNFWRA
jgi:hypothetical protein